MSPQGNRRCNCQECPLHGRKWVYSARPGQGCANAPHNTEHANIGTCGWTGDMIGLRQIAIHCTPKTLPFWVM
eukprot:5782025-Amphidinium_carterae.1